MRFWGNVFVFLVVMPCLVSSANAQTKIGYQDMSGTWHVVDVEDAPQMPSRNRTAVGTAALLGEFTVEFEDVLLNTGVGFDDPVFGATRRSTINSVFAYIGSLLDEPGSAEILVASSETDGSGALAFAGPFLNVETGFQNGLVFEHLTTGVDPNNSVPDGIVTVDFGYSWNSDLGNPMGSEFDLFTVLLHEMTHGLGILSLAAPDGTSELINEGGFGAYSVLDDFLRLSSNGKDLFRAGGESNALPADLISDDVVFVGPRARETLSVPPEIYAPSPYQSGSSISHWGFSTDLDAIMLPSVAPGVQKRTYLDWELQALGDLGYNVIACGDGFVAGDEECDDANNNNTDSCLNTCVEPECGDNVVQGDEECDDGGANSDSTPNACRTSCEEAFCGDGVADDGEACDDGNDNEDDACLNDCRFAECGDGVLSVGEECDDANANNDDACPNTCQDAECGDGVIRTGVEECDDANTDDGDGCSATCEEEMMVPDAGMPPMGGSGGSGATSGSGGIGGSMTAGTGGSDGPGPGASLEDSAGGACSVGTSSRGAAYLALGLLGWTLTRRRRKN